MAIQLGRDYAFHPKTTYVGRPGIGDGCLVCTRRYALMIPTRINEFIGSLRVIKKRFAFGERPVAEALGEFLAAPDTTIDDLETFITHLAEAAEETVFVDIGLMQRLKVGTGLLTKGLYFNTKPAGLGGWIGFALKGKEHLPAFVDLYGNSQILVKR